MLREVIEVDGETFGQMIKRLRVERRWTQGDLAERAAITQSSVSQVELDKGKSRTSETVQRLARAFGADPHDWLVHARVIPAPTASPRTITIETRHGDRAFSVDEAVAYVEAKPDRTHQERLARWRRTMAREDYERVVAKIYAAWSSGADGILGGLEIVAGPDETAR